VHIYLLAYLWRFKSKIKVLNFDIRLEYPWQYITESPANTAVRDFGYMIVYNILAFTRE